MEDVTVNEWMMLNGKRRKQRPMEGAMEFEEGMGEKKREREGCNDERRERLRKKETAFSRWEEREGKL